MAAEPMVHVVDDEAAIRDSLAVLLDSSGLSVAVYESAADFLDCDPSGPGCLLLDVRMPGMDGLALQEELRRRGRRIPVIVMTGHADVTLAVRAMKAGAIDFVEKPFEEAAILGAVRHALALGQPTPPLAPEADGEAAGRLGLLTPREREVLEALIAGKPNKIIAFDLAISPRTVEIHRARVMEKMQARSLSDLVRMALAAGVNPRLS